MAESPITKNNIQDIPVKTTESSEPVIHVMPDKFLKDQPKYIAPESSPEKGTAPVRGKWRQYLIIIILAVVVLLILGGVGFYLFYQLQSQQNNNTNVVNNNAGANENLNLNSNANENININENTNTEINVNLNTNVNVNSNINNNINITQIRSSKDSDNDLLTDVEEVLYGTTPTKPDSDGDGYIDGQEILAGYNPMGKGDLRPDKNSKILTAFESAEFPFVIGYLKGWTVDTLDKNGRTVLFTSATGEIIQIVVTDNTKAESALSWYLAQFPELDAKDLDTVTNYTQEENGIKSINGDVVYYNDKDYIYAISYNYGTKMYLDFDTTFQMMAREFRLVPKQESSEVNSNANSNANTNSATDLNTNSTSNSNAN